MKKQLLFISVALLLSWSTNAQMTLEFNTNLSDGTTIMLPLQGTVNVAVNWGDGKSDTYTTEGNTNHEYTAEGTYTVSISGSLTQFGNGWDETLKMDKLVKVTSFGNIGLTSLSGAFFGATNLVELPTQLPSTVENLSYMLYGASSFNFDIGSWNVSKVTDMSDMFHNAHVFNKDISSWDVSNVTNMNSMFNGAYVFNQDIGGWVVNKVTAMSKMFYRAFEFNQNIGRWDVSKVTNMEGMFMEAYLFNQDIGSWNVSSVTNLNNMLRLAKVFNQDIGAWNVSKVTEIAGIFYEAYVFNQDISKWNTGSVTKMGWMFTRARAFNQDISTKLINAGLPNEYIAWDVSKVTNMTEMFRFASEFNQDIGGWDVSNVTDMMRMFEYATAFDQDIGSWDVKKNWQFGNMFERVTLSTNNYDNLLIGWAKQTVMTGKYFSGGDSKYSAGAAADARAVLTGTYGWTITDGGMVVSDVASTVADNIILYPNPFRNEIRLSNASDASRIVVTNVIGKVVLDQPAKQIIETNLPSGIYLFTIIAHDGSKVLRKMMRE